jgi:hypothetical protein
MPQVCGQSLHDSHGPGPQSLQAPFQTMGRGHEKQQVLQPGPPQGSPQVWVQQQPVATRSEAQASARIKRAIMAVFPIGPKGAQFRYAAWIYRPAKSPESTKSR